MAQTLNDIEALYRERYPVFLRVAIAVTGDEQAARDAVHDGFVLVVRRRRQLRDAGALEPWVWRIVVNEARKRRAREASSSMLDADVETAPNGSRAVAADVRALVAALPERQRLALFLRYYADLDYAAIARALGVRPGTVAASLNSAHATLRSQLEEVLT